MKPVDIRNETWADIQARLSEDRMTVYNGLLLHGPASTRGLARTLGMDVLSVRPRCTELLQLGLVELRGKDQDGGVYAALPFAEARWRFENAKKAAEEEQMVLL